MTFHATSAILHPKSYHIREHWTLENKLHWVRRAGLFSFKSIIGLSNFLNFLFQVRCGSKPHLQVLGVPNWTKKRRTKSPCWVRDTIFQEDASSVRTGVLPQVMAALRNTAISVLNINIGKIPKNKKSPKLRHIPSYHLGSARHSDVTNVTFNVTYFINSASLLLTYSQG